ncbi:hypothetical protein CEUSTIGMA_g5132.t1 [Chlamydomonas eustigma]|uniref:Globin family profile domain-containing protein n=1 Tax=Chlamydomonas eustigma TaxID=1157962 RepID=A0A250X440_9CHLO|nr:hypothetical protein CEUSTIGMA_g5132.t1 [Chlamydomonas eustigma]|eukprot:GAX77689.1 hypothetical protein CEUSTIGMA_g5132.t1 [Chlamydomonas eustigma]
MEDAECLFVRLGGRGVLEKFVDMLFRKVLADPALSIFFKGVSMDRHTNHLVAFFKILFDITSAYGKFNVEAMAVAHAQLIREKGVGLEQFDQIVRMMEESFLEVDILPDLVEEAKSLLVTLRPAFDPSKKR